MHEHESHGLDPGPGEPGVEPAASLDAEGFAALYRDSHRVLWLIAVGVLVDRHLAEDAVQEAVIIGLRKLDSFQPGTNFTAWMGQIVRHVSLNHRRKHGRHRALSLDAGHDPGPARPGDPSATTAPSPIDERGVMRHDTEHFDDRLLSALASVGETARACLLLRTLEGLNYKQIARVLDIPEGTAMSHVHRTRKQLRQTLSETTRQGVGPEGATS